MYIIRNIPSSSCLRIGTHIVFFLFNVIIFFNYFYYLYLFLNFKSSPIAFLTNQKTIFKKHKQNDSQKMFKSYKIIYWLWNILRFLVYNSESQIQRGYAKSISSNIPGTTKISWITDSTLYFWASSRYWGKKWGWIFIFVPFNSNVGSRLMMLAASLSQSLEFTVLLASVQGFSRSVPGGIMYQLSSP